MKLHSIIISQPNGNKPHIVLRHDLDNAIIVASGVANILGSMPTVRNSADCDSANFQVWNRIADNTGIDPLSYGVPVR